MQKRKLRSGVEGADQVLIEIREGCERGSDPEDHALGEVQCLRTSEAMRRI